MLDFREAKKIIKRDYSDPTTISSTDKESYFIIIIAYCRHCIILYLYYIILNQFLH